MALSFRTSSDPEPTEAVVFADGFADVDALADDFDLEFGPGNWMDVRNSEAMTVLANGAEDATFAIVAVSSDTPQAIDGTAELIRAARDTGLPVLLIVGDISSRATHRLMREGVAEFTPYPTSDGELQEAISRIRMSANQTNLPMGPGMAAPIRQGMVVTAYGTAGGVGASTFAVNLAWEMALLTRKKGKKIALLDFNFQYGSIATYLDVPRREAVYELVSEAASLDQTGLTQALSSYNDKLHVLTAPRDALPLDIVSPGDISAIIKLAREAFDYIIIDMPQSLMNWSEQVYSASDVFYALMEVDMRSAQNMFRFLRTLKSEDMALDKIKFVLNRAPGITDLSGKARVRRVADSLGLEFSVMLPDGGRYVTNACDQGVPLAEAAKSNGLRKEILKVAKAVLEMQPENAVARAQA
ncbi:MAG: CpaE family protein [Paracoccaceae bacterium]